MSRPKFSRAARALPWAALAACIFASTARAALPTSYWRQRVFLIPYQSPAAGQTDPRVAKVELLVSPAGTGEWRLLQQAEPTVRGFSFNAPADGAYDFALRTVDAHGAASPAQVAQPMLRVVVDTQRPDLRLTASADAAGRLLVRYEATDPQLVWESLRLEVQPDGRNWEPATLSPADLRQPNRVVGQWTWPATTGVGTVGIRAMVSDRAGNQALATTSVTLSAMRTTTPIEPQTPATSPLESGPLLGPAAGGDSLPTTTTGGGLGLSPLRTPRTAASFVADSRAPASNPFGNSGPMPASPNAASVPTSLDNFAPPLLAPSAPLAAATPQPIVADAPVAADVGPTPGEGWTSPGHMDPRDAGGRWVNTLAFDLDYELETVGPWGVARVELWATRDEGRTWTSLGVDDDNRAPMRVTVPTAGVYGFRIAVDGANGQAAPKPQLGDKPELVVGVDLQPPRAALVGATQGQGSLAGTLLVRWSAADDNLEERPVSLFFSAAAEGPWTTIATDLANTGEYAWQLPRTMPAQIFLRLDAHDRAGNVTARRTPAPVALNLPQPTGRIRAIRPVASDPSRYRTASGPAGSR